MMKGRKGRREGEKERSGERGRKDEWKLWSWDVTTKV